MIKPKNLNMDRIEQIFNDNFEFDSAELQKGITRWTISPKRHQKANLKCPACGFQLSKGDDALVCSKCDEFYYESEIL